MSNTTNKTNVYWLFLLIGFLYSSETSGQYLIKGYITNTNDYRGIVGATIRLSKGQLQTQSDKKGKFQITTPMLPDTLIVSYIGAITKRLVVTSENYSNELTITFDNKGENLKEVIISTGYQQIPKARATGAFSTIGNKQFNQQISTGVMERLEATASGIAVDRSTNSSGRLMVRGISTIGGPRSPLIILDNNPYEGDISNINPNDVESITVLKDAAAASIWGTRAGNGVIVITTKKALYDQPISIEINSNLTVSSKPDLDYIKQMSTSDFIDVEKLLYANNFYRTQINSSSKPSLSPVVELLIKRSTASSSGQAAIDEQIDQFRNYDIRNEFDKYFYQTSANQQYALNIKAGTQTNAWLISGGYDHNTSNLDALYKRFNLRANNSLKLTKNLILATNLLYTQSNTKSGKPGFGQITVKGFNPFPYARFADDNGNPIVLTKDYRLPYLQNLNTPGLADWNYYPLTDYQHNTTRNSLQDMIMNLALDYQILPGLKMSLQYQHEKQGNDRQNEMDKENYFVRNLFNLYSAVNADGVAVSKIPEGGILDLSTTEMRSNQWRGQLNYDKNWNKHQLTLLTGAEIRETVTIGNMYRTYGYNSNNLSFGSVDFTTAYPTFINGSSTFIPDNKSFTNQSLRFVSLYGNGAYTYMNKYTVSGSIRRDATNLFGVSTNNKWKPLWSVGMAWNVANETFIQAKAIDKLNLRITYGFSGNADPARVAVTTLFNQGNSIYSNSSFYSFDQFANPELKWETVSQLNAGIDFSFFNQRISGSFDTYIKTASDLFGVVPVDYTSGVGFQVQKNVAKIQGKGLDIVINTLNTNGMVKWSTDLNFSFHKDIVKEYYNPDLRAANFMTQSSPRVSGITGQAIYGIYAYPWAGLEANTGLPQGYVNGEVSKNYRTITGTTTNVKDVIYYGSALPVYYGSLGNTIAYKAFSVEARLLFKLGYYFRRSTIDYTTLNSQWNGHSDFTDRWQKPGDERHTNIPALVYPIPSGMSSFYQNAEPFVTKGDHIRLQYITMNYRYIPRGSNKIPFKSINFYSSLSNIGLIWKANKQGIDPDYANGYATLTPPLSIAVGLKANF